VKESITLTMAEVDEFLNMLGETWPIKYGRMFQQVQQFFQSKFAEDTVISDNNSVNYSTPSV